MLVLTRLLVYLALKDDALPRHRYPCGRRHLRSFRARRRKRPRNGAQGIGRLLKAGAAPADVAHLFEPYLAIVGPYVASENPRYPGSPALAAALLRKQDRMIFCEAHPDVANALKAHLGRDKRAKIIEIDGFIGLGAYVPPVERRGLVLIDPPFESRDEFAHILSRLDTALRKWPTGAYMIWFPIKDRAAVSRFYRDLAAVVSASGAKEALRLELWIDAIDPGGPLASNGLALINPPYVLEQEMRIILPYLAQVLAASPQAGYAISPL